jgi:hypothetical protein
MARHLTLRELEALIKQRMKQIETLLRRRAKYEKKMEKLDLQVKTISGYKRRRRLKK